MNRKTFSTTIARALIIGSTATAVMDIASEIVRKTTGVPPLNLDFVGRWVLGMKDGKFVHESIAQSPSIPHEQAVGIAAHYLIGIGFAGLFDSALPQWSRNPRLIGSIAAGVSTTIAPWFLMQPAFGLGFMASKNTTTGGGCIP
ncbi:DUF2938 family protein [Corynebacterium sp. sy039]|uniref:DUF2938 family protein n=1 Tax=Corynebacterium sp. sy039 TaxID=2599641 RepID=UPI001AEF5930|nr:DUF2938 family protein [Corynebacterium sp. sy039]